METAPYRPDLAYCKREKILERVTPGSICAELGTFRGEFAQKILSVCRPALLYVVDTFDGTVLSGDADGMNVERENMAEMFHLLGAEFKDRPVELVKAVSWEWLKSIRPASLDFVYIDTDHSYDTTLRELGASRVAVRKNGLICGHDYNAHVYPGVFNAVTTFAQMNDLFVEIYAGDKLASYLMLNK